MPFGPLGGSMTMRGSLPSFQAMAQNPQAGQPLTPQNMQALMPQFTQPQAQPNVGSTAPNWLQYWPGALGGPTGGLNPDGTLPGATPPPAPPQGPLTGGFPTDPYAAGTDPRWLQMYNDQLQDSTYPGWQ